MNSNSKSSHKFLTITISHVHADEPHARNLGEDQLKLGLIRVADAHRRCDIGQNGLARAGGEGGPDGVRGRRRGNATVGVPRTSEALCCWRGGLRNRLALATGCDASPEPDEITSALQPRVSRHCRHAVLDGHQGHAMSG